MNNETERPINFEELDPTRDPVRFDGLVRNVMQRAEGELASRRAANNVVGELARWRKPMFAAAAAATAFLVFSLNGMTPSDTTEPTGIAEAIGVPTELATWARAETQPSIADLYAGLFSQ